MMQDSLYIEQSHEKCAVCYEFFDNLSQNLLKLEKISCETCGAEVHKYCYSPASKSKIIKCAGCQAKEISKTKIKCCVCENSFGIMKKIKNADSTYGHIACLLFSPNFLVESYRQLEFIQIATIIKTKNFLCSVCNLQGSIQNSCPCSFEDCQEAIHWECLYKVERDGFWTSSIKQLNFLEKPRISLPSLYEAFKDHLNKYFEEVIFQRDGTNKIGVERQIKAGCGKHLSIFSSTCKCQRQIPSNFIQCSFCRSLNHLKCQNRSKLALLDQYKCLQCQDWEVVVKKKKRPYLSEYPNMNIHDYIYIHCFYQQSGYLLSERESELICRLPIYPSLRFFRHFLQSYASSELNPQISIQMLRQEVENEEPHILNTKQIAKAMKLTKILLSEYKQLPELKQEFIQLNNEFNVTQEQIIKTLKEYDRKRMKARKNLSNPMLNKVKPQLHQRVQPTVSEKLGQNTNQSETFIKIEKSQCIQIISCKEQLEQWQEKREESIETVSGGQQYILKEIQQVQDKSRVSVLDWERDLLLRRQERATGRSSHQNKDAELLRRICLKSFEMDLKNEKFGLTIDARVNMLQFFKIQSENKSHSFEISSKIVKIQESLTNLMLSLNRNSDKLKKISLLSDLKGFSIQHSSIENWFSFFSQLKGVNIKKYSVLLEVLEELVPKLVQIKGPITTCQQFEAYQVMGAYFNVKNEWLEKQIQKKGEVQRNIERVVTQLRRGKLKNYLCEDSHNLSSQILQCAAAFCQLNKMHYLLPKIEQYLAWNEIYQSCASNIPISYLSPIQTSHQIQQNQQNKKLNGQTISRIISRMKQSNFPNNRIHNLVESYADKYRESRQDLLNFLQIFEMNLKESSSRNIKYFESQVLQWLKEAANGVFEFDLITRQVEQVVCLFRRLKIQISVTNCQLDKQKYRELQNKIDTIPITFDINQQRQKLKQQEV